MRSPDFWVSMIHHIVERLTAAGLAGVAKAQIEDAHRAVGTGVIGAMAQACRGLVALLPAREQEGIDVPAIVSHVR